MIGWLTLAQGVTVVNLAVLAALSAVWVRNYRRHGASHTLGFLVVGAFLLVENALWLYFYTVHPAFVGWFRGSDPDVQVGLTALCSLELVALVVLARLTYR